MDYLLIKDCWNFFGIWFLVIFVNLDWGKGVKVIWGEYFILGWGWGWGEGFFCYLVVNWFDFVFLEVNVCVFIWYFSIIKCKDLYLNRFFLWGSSSEKILYIRIYLYNKKLVYWIDFGFKESLFIFVSIIVIKMV